MLYIADMPNIAGQNIDAIYHLLCGSFVIMCTKIQCFYIGEVLDIYKQGASSHYGSMDDTSTTSG